MIRNKSRLLFIVALGFVALVTACGQDYNSNSSDGGVEGLSCSSAAELRMCTAYKALQQKCFKCHSAWAELKTDQQWKTSGLVAVGSPTGSQLLSRTRNLGGDMPPSGNAPLKDSEYTSISNWIQQL
jgi:hypothetical protein